MKTAAFALLATAVLCGTLALAAGGFVDHALASIQWGGLTR